MVLGAGRYRGSVVPQVQVQRSATCLGARCSKVQSRLRTFGARYAYGTRYIFMKETTFISLDNVTFWTHIMFVLDMRLC